MDIQKAHARTRKQNQSNTIRSITNKQGKRICETQHKNASSFIKQLQNISKRFEKVLFPGMKALSPGIRENSQVNRPTDIKRKSKRMVRRNKKWKIERKSKIQENESKNTQPQKNTRALKRISSQTA